MPKALSQEERELSKQSLKRVGLTLIKSKGLRHVTVDDITKAAGIAKGSFYLHYQSKEELLYEVFHNSEKKVFEAIFNFNNNSEDFRGKIEKALYDIYLAPDSIALYIQPEDIEYIRRKFPSEIQKIDKERRQSNFARTMVLFGLSETDMGTLAYLMDGLQYIATRPFEYRETSHQQSLSICVRAIAEFVNEKATKKHS